MLLTRVKSPLRFHSSALGMTKEVWWGRVSRQASVVGHSILGPHLLHGPLQGIPFSYILFFGSCMERDYLCFISLCTSPPTLLPVPHINACGMWKHNFLPFLCGGRPWYAFTEMFLYCLFTINYVWSCSWASPCVLQVNQLGDLLQAKYILLVQSPCR